MIKRIGEYLGLDCKIIERSLTLQKESIAEGRMLRFGELLLQEGAVTKRDLSSALKRQRLDRLAASPLFAGLSAKELKKISEFINEVSAAEGDEIIRQDTKGDCFFILASGHAEVCRIGDYGEKIPLTFIGPCESIGEVGYFSDGHRTASVFAKERCELLRINYSDLKDIFRNVPAITNNFLEMISGRLRRTNIRFQEVAERGLVAEENLASICRFLDMSEFAALSSGVDGLIERIVLTSGRVMEAERATLFLLDAASGELWSVVAEGQGKKEIRMPIRGSVAGWALSHDRIVNIPDAYMDDRFDQSIDLATGFCTRNILAGPIKSLQGEIVGAIEVINKKVGNFGARDEALFKAFAYQAAVAIENHHLYNQLLSSHRQMGILLDVSTALSQTLDLDKLIIEIVNRTCEILDAERGTLFLWERENNQLWSMVAMGEDMREIRISADAGLAGYVANTGATLNIADAYRDSRFNPDVDRNSGFLTRTVLCMPVVNRNGRIIGVTETINKRRGQFNQNDIEMLRALNSHIAVALENAQLYRTAINMKNYLSSVQNSISNAIITIDEECRVITANRAAMRLFAIDQADIGKTGFFSLFKPGDNTIIELVRRVEENRQAVVDYDVELTSAKGERHTVNINFVPLQDPDEGRRGLVLIFENITMEKRLKGTLTRYMPKEIVERILEDPSHQALGGVKNRATIMFTDIRKFTGMAESLSAEQTVDFLNQYFSVMVDRIMANGGVLDKYIGDNIMAVFGVPYPREDDAVRAARTALQMRSSLVELNATRRSAGLELIRIGIGICTGNVISGNIGTERRMEYTVIGDDVNIASRLENLCGYYGVDILVGETTLRELGDRFVSRPVDYVYVKGRKKPIQIFEVLDEGKRTLTEAESEFCEGLDLYRKGNFEGAARRFETHSTRDNLCSLFLDRCRDFMMTPPPKGWSGTWIFDEKKLGH